MEAALVLPLVLVFLAAFLSLFTVMDTELHLHHSMSSALRTYICEDAVTFQTSAPSSVESELIHSGAMFSPGTGFTLEGTGCSGPDGEEYRIQVSCSPAIPFFDGISTRLHIGESVSRRAWIGRSFEETPDSRTVYVTETGSVYHTSLSCSYLTLSVRETAFSALAAERNRDGSIYYPCEYCGGDPHGETVYVTGYGTRWHARRDCSGLRRGIRRISLYEAGGLPLCSRCRERSGE